MMIKGWKAGLACSLVSSFIATGCALDDPQLDEATSEAVVPLQLRGLATTTFRPPGDFVSWDWNRCVPNPTLQVQRLKPRGDILGINLGNARDPDEGQNHWQGVVRLPVATGHQFVFDLRQPNYAVFAVGSVAGHMRNSANLRLGGNRTSSSTQDWHVQPEAADWFRNDWAVAPGLPFKHVGGMQGLGSYVLMAVEDGGQPGQIRVWDFAGFNDAIGGPVSTGWLSSRTPYAAFAGGVKLADNRFLFVTAQQDSDVLEFYVSTGTSITSPGPWYWGILDRNTVAGFRTYYQHVSLLTACPEDMQPGDAPAPGTIYLLGTTSTDHDGGGEDWLDLFRLSVVWGADPKYPGSSYRVTATWVASKHMACSSDSYERQCDFAAAVGTYVDPQGRLLVYAAEHDNDGPGDSVKMMEYRSVDHLDAPGTTTVEGCSSLEDAFVEFYDAPLDATIGVTTATPNLQRSYLIEFLDRNLRSQNFGTAYDFNDRARAVRYCIPAGYSYRIWTDVNRSGTSTTLRGDATIAGTGAASAGAIKGYNWNPQTPPGWSSGCFVSNTNVNECI